MTEISLNILDVAQNSVRAEASLITLEIEIDTASDSLTIRILDDGSGMSEEQVQKVTDPFFTTRDTRKIGLGVPFFKEAALSAGGSFGITSEQGKGTEVKAVFSLSHIDRQPLGDITGTLETLVFYNTGMDFVYRYSVDGKGFSLDTREIREILDGLPIDAPEVKEYISGYLRENTAEVNNGRIY